MSRREFLATGAAAAAGMAAGAFADWQPSPRYPDPRILIIDPTFAKFRLATAKVERRHLQRRGQAHRPHPAPGTVCERLLRRPPSQSPVHGR